MRAIPLILASALVGASLGVGLSWARNGGASSAEAIHLAAEGSAAGGVSVSDDAPQVVVDSDVHDFGTIENDSTVSHGFLFTNTGRSPLTLKAGGTTCQKCTIAEITQSTLAPGESVAVNVQYHAGESTPRFRQSATILTNDPRRPRVELSVTGSISALLELVPPQLVFSKLSVHEPSTLETRLVSHRTDHLEITGHEWSDPTTAEFFEATWTPLDEDALKAMNARSGMKVAVTIKPGLPLGLVRQRLKLTTDLPNKRSAELNIQATVASDLSVVGSGWNADEGYLKLGTVSGSTGVKRNLLILVHGPYRNDIQLNVEETFPSFMKVTLGEKSTISDGAVVRIPLTLEIPPGSPSANHLGSKQGSLGRITLSTTHPDVKEFRIPVRFAVED